MWPQLVTRVRAERGMSLFSMIASAKPERIHRGALEVSVSNSLAQGSLQNEVDFLSEILSGLAGQPTPLRFVVSQAERRETVAADDPFEKLKQLRQTDPVVQALFEKLGAEIVWN
ncbi:hypothetical protein BSZ36_08460 [Rubricoccus marinus]|uniref:DNA polymerase III tau subunit domain-containing protein n=1 Tax=Rubricoccus marinus TaxID=716817 RepID=A0A259TZ18_9BACT|nr:hypothetical protein BSZ36_08460 [Rubricoccus marinus]